MLNHDKCIQPGRLYSAATKLIESYHAWDKNNMFKAKSQS